jgi:outer membrane receptor protein involved in Fe transport
LSGRIGASYSAALGRGLIAKLSADAAYTDEYNFTDALRPDGVQDAFTRVDASVSVGCEDGVWEVALIGRNITDELVVTSANDMPSQVSAASAGTGTVTGRRSDMNAIVERPRQIYLQVSTRF